MRVANAKGFCFPLEVGSALVICMSEYVIKQCPRCGKKTTDRLIVQCPECDVPLIHDFEPRSPLTPDQLRLIAKLILGSWKFWAGVAMVVALAAWGVIEVAEQIIERRTTDYLDTLEQQATNHIRVVYGQLSNQIVREFQQPRIRATMEQIANEHFDDILTNSIWPSLEAFRQSLNEANAQLAKSTNDLAALAKEVKLAQRKVTPKSTAVVATDEASKLTLVDQAVARNGSNYILSLFFKATGSQVIGVVDLIAGTYRQTARILNFASVTPGQSEPAVMNDLGDAARLKFTPPRGDAPIVIALELTAPTIVRVSGDVLDGDLTVPVAADKLSAPTASK